MAVGLHTPAGQPHTIAAPFLSHLFCRLIMRLAKHLAVTAAALFTICACSSTTDTAASNSSTTVTKAETLRTDMRKLWEDHVTWTRNVIFNLADNLPGSNEALTRLLKNQDDIGNAVATYYGTSAGQQLSALLHTHILESADVVNAAKAGDNTALAAANAKWTANADSIASFLSTANPNLALADMKTMMHDHLTLTTNEAVARLQHDYTADVAAYDAVHNEILSMSDMIANAIVKQFPSQF
jgi:hypothetical protein